MASQPPVLSDGKESEEENKETEVFEIKDFTCATRWERLIAVIESQLRQWHISDEKERDKGGVLSRRISWRPFEGTDREYTLQYHQYQNTGPSRLLSPSSTVARASRKEMPLSSHGERAVHDINRRPDFLGPRILRAFGLRRYLILLPSDIASALDRSEFVRDKDLDSYGVSENEARFLLSSLALACDSCNCSLACFTMVGEGRGCVPVGQVGYPYPLRFHTEALRRSEVPKNLQFLSGLSKHLKKRRGETGKGRKTMVAAAITFQKNASEAPNLTPRSPKGPFWSSEATEQDISLFPVPMGGKNDPLESIMLYTSWPSFPEGSFDETPTISELDPGLAPSWVLACRFAEGRREEETGAANWAKNYFFPRDRNLATARGVRALRRVMESYIQGFQLKRLDYLLANRDSKSNLGGRISGVWRVHPTGYTITLRMGENGIVVGKNDTQTGAWEARISGKISRGVFEFTQIASGKDVGSEGYRARCRIRFDGRRMFNGTWKDSNDKSGTFWCIRQNLSLHESPPFENSDLLSNAQPPPPTPTATLALRSRQNPTTTVDLKVQKKEEKSGRREGHVAKPSVKAMPSDAKKNSGKSGVVGWAPCPMGSVLCRVSRRVEALGGGNGRDVYEHGLAVVGNLWKEVVGELRMAWETKEDIKHLYSGPRPDPRYCVIHQRLQALQFCINASRPKRNPKRPIRHPGLQACESESDSSIEEKQEEGEYLLKDPKIMDICPLSTDEAQSLSIILSKLEDEHSTAAAVISRQWRGIAETMQGFKFANPDAKFEAFAVWRTLKLREGPISAYGYLDPRGAKIPKKALQVLWHSLPACPIERQTTTFDPTLLAEQTLDRLETLTPRDLLSQLAGVAFYDYTCSLQSSQAYRIRVPRAVQALDTFNQKLAPIPVNPGIPAIFFEKDREGEMTLDVKRLRGLLWEMERIEKQIAKADSLAARLGNHPNIIHHLLTTQKASVDMTRRLEITKVFVQDVEGRKRVLQSHSRYSSEIGKLLEGSAVSKEYVFQNTSRPVAMKTTNKGDKVKNLLNSATLREYVAIESRTVTFAGISSVAKDLTY